MSEQQPPAVPKWTAPPRTPEWAARNCHMLARREIRRLNSWKKDGGDTTPVGMAVTAWEHVLRICEESGVTSNNGPLRAAPSERPTQEPLAHWLTAREINEARSGNRWSLRILESLCDMASAALRAQPAPPTEERTQERIPGVNAPHFVTGMSVARATPEAPQTAGRPACAKCGEPFSFERMGVKLFDGRHVHYRDCLDDLMAIPSADDADRPR